MAGRRDPFLVAVVLCSLAAAVGSLDRDPYLAQPWAMVLPPPSLWPIRLVMAVVCVLGLGLLFARDRPSSRTGAMGAATLTLLSGLLLFLATPLVRPRVHFACAVLNFVLLGGMALYLLRSHPSPRPNAVGRSGIANAVTMAVTVGLVFLVGEAVASLRTASHAVGYTLASRAWFSRFWTPRNSEGYRDLERAGAPGRRIDVLGDSFVTGVGIADIEDRFSNILDRRLSPGFHVRNLGWNGSDTRDQLQRLVALPTPPDLLILSYYANDIQGACLEAGHRLPGFAPYSNLSVVARGLVRRSYLLDALYWRLPQADLAGYEGTLEDCYRDPKALALHLRDAFEVVTYCRRHGVPLLVVAFPHLVRAETSRRLLGPVIDSFRTRVIAVLDVYTLLEGLEVHERIVNPNDAHPSILLNRLVAEGVLSSLQSSGLLQEAAAPAVPVRPVRERRPSGRRWSP